MNGPQDVALDRAHALAIEYLHSLAERRVGVTASYEALTAALGGTLPDGPEAPEAVVEEMFRRAVPGIMATAGPRYFGLVIGGSLPAALAADWLTGAWDQNAFAYVTSPASGAVEEVCRVWLAEMLDLPADASVGFVTGATMANFTCLAAARHALLRREGWDVEEHGLFGAPPFTVITSEESHVTIFAALQMLGLGRSRVVRVATDGQGRMRVDALRETIASASGPFVVCAQAGNVNTGAFDPMAEIAPLVQGGGGWLHVDGAFGAWAAASRRHAYLTAGMALADSVAVDAHKWLNVPYDCGLAFTRHAGAHRAAMSLEASYYTPTVAEVRNNHHFVPDSSRRARGFAVYAALRSLGRSGVEQLVDRCCAHARRMAERLSSHDGVHVLNDVVLNQVLVRFDDPDGGDADTFTADVIRRVQEDGTCWLGGSNWQGRHVMRISVSNWSTTEADIDRSADAILRCAAIPRATRERDRSGSTAARE